MCVAATLEPTQWSLILMQVWHGRLFAVGNSCWEPMSWPMPRLSTTINTHVCEVTSLFHHALDTKDFGADGDHDRAFHRTYWDLFKIEGSCGGPLQHAVWLKQVQSIGVRMWGQDDPDAACAAGNHVRVWVFTTDQGPDQVAASKLLQTWRSRSLTS